jgi:predicted phage-related endonuclease
MTSTTTVTTTVTTTANAVELGVSAEALLVEFNNVKDALKRLEAVKATLDEKLRNSLGDATIGLINGIERVKVSTRTRTGVDTAVLAAAFPEAFEATKTSTTYTVLTTK